MSPMTTQCASARPYSVFFDLPTFFRGLVTIKDSATFINKGLEPGQIDSYKLDGNRGKTIAACILTSMLVWAFLAIFALAEFLDSLMLRDYVKLAWVGGGVLAALIAITVSSRFITRRKKAFDAAIADMDGKIAPVPKGGGRRRDLWRIQEALDSLQPEHGTAYDDRAREAVAAVLNQNRHRPDEKHLIIADSTADDSDSVAIRARALAAKAAWGHDVAKAEHLILALEDAAGSKVPVAV